MADGHCPPHIKASRALCLVILSISRASPTVAGSPSSPRRAAPPLGLPGPAHAPLAPAGRRQSPPPPPPPLPPEYLHAHARSTVASPRPAGLPQSSARPAAVGPTHRSPYDFDVSADILADLDWKIDYYVNLSVPDGTGKKDVLAWQRWSMFCSGLGTTPWRMDRDVHSGADPVGFDRETRLLTAFLLHCHEIVKPRSAKDLAAKPDSITRSLPSAASTSAATSR